MLFILNNRRREVVVSMCVRALRVSEVLSNLCLHPLASSDFLQLATAVGEPGGDLYKSHVALHSQQDLLVFARIRMIEVTAKPVAKIFCLGSSPPNRKKASVSPARCQQEVMLKLHGWTCICMWSRHGACGQLLGYSSTAHMMRTEK